MKQTVLRGRGREITRIPRSTWAEELAQAPAGIKARLDFMSEEHHKVRYHVVEQLPRHGRPLEPEAIADNLGLALPRVREILDELERKLFFLVRDEINFRADDGDYEYLERGEYAGKTRPVGSYPPNKLGLHDMSGNAWEWTSDKFAEYTDKPQTNPYVTEGANHALRGGRPRGSGRDADRQTGR